MALERLYVVAYDISDPKRWRKVFKLMHGYGKWVQLSMFQCRLTRIRHAEMIADIDLLIHHDADHVLILDLGSADEVDLKVISLGKGFEPVSNDPIIV